MAATADSPRAINPPRYVAITGAGGMIGSAAYTALRPSVDRVTRLVRSATGAAEDVPWNPAGTSDLSALRDCTHILHLAGAPIAGGPWTARRRALIRSSRVDATATLVRDLLRQCPSPRTLICASATGFYGHRGAEWLEESAPAGSGFLPDVVRAWEGALQPARDAGWRVVSLRFGMVLSTAGGALRAMLPAYRTGLGGPLGDGSQYWSWIALEDAVAAIRFVLDNPSLSGAVNAVAPYPVTQREFAMTLARRLRRPARLRVPAGLLRLMLGGLADELLLAGARARPAALSAAGFRFRHEILDGALAASLRMLP